MPLTVDNLKDEVAIQQLIYGVIAASPSWEEAK